MKLLTPKEVQDKKQAELVKNIERIKLIDSELDKKTKALNELNAKFEVTLANQRLRLRTEEDAAMSKIGVLNKEISDLEKRKAELLVPIEERERKSYDLINAAEETFNEAQDKLHKAEQKGEENEHTAEILQDKLDELSERESNVLEREQKVFVREKAVEEERNLIKRLSSELSINLQNIK